MNTEDILKFVSPILVGFLAAYYGSVLALRKFKQEKTWNERREAYKEVIESLEELIHWSEQIRASHCCEPTIGGEANFDDALRKISKFSATGSLVFSDEFQEVLKETKTQISKARFEVNEESKPDIHTEAGSAEWHFVLAKEIRGIVEENLPILIGIAKSEIP